MHRRRLGLAVRVHERPARDVIVAVGRHYAGFAWPPSRPGPRGVDGLDRTDELAAQAQREAESKRVDLVVATDARAQSCGAEEEPRRSPPVAFVAFDVQLHAVRG